MKEVKRGEVYYADLSATVGSEQGGRRPVLIIQNDTGNKFSPTVIVAALTSKIGKRPLPTHVNVECKCASLVLLEQVRTIDKRRLEEYVCTLSDNEIQRVNKSIMVSMGL